MTDVVIVGGGIAGLAAAYELTRRAVPFVLLEAGPRLGGVVLSEQVDDYVVDAGPDSLLTLKPDGIRLCLELGLGERLVPTRPPRIAFVQRGGKLHPLPAFSVFGIPTRVWPLARTRLFSWPGKVRMAAEPFVAPRREDGDESVGDFMTRRFGTEATTYLAEPLLAGIHAGDVQRLSIQSLFPRLTEAEKKYGSLIRAFRSEGRSRALNASNEGLFRSLPGGLTELVTAVSLVLPRESVSLRTPVTALLRAVGASGYRVEIGSGESLQARAVILATPAFVTARLIRGMDAGLAKLCDEIPYASTATVVLAFRRAAVTHSLRGTGFVVPRAEGPGILAASWLSSKWPGRAPEDRVLLRAFIGGARDPYAMDRSDQELVSIALKALRPILGIGGPPLLTRVYRWERASAQHEVGHRVRVEAIDRVLAGLPGLHLTGSGFRGVGIPDCVADARAAAAQVAAWIGGSLQPEQKGVS
jgi:oxygen-dependent protoporphyrinogen oxidase